jgi:hypothetical protein
MNVLPTSSSFDFQINIQNPKLFSFHTLLLSQVLIITSNESKPQKQYNPEKIINSQDVNSFETSQTNPET